MKRIIIIFMAIVILFVFASCKSVENNVQNNSSVAVASTEPFVLAKLSGETLNPILAKSNTNLELLRLCYDGLIRLNGEYEPELIIAENYSQNGNTFEFTIKPNAKFWDGSAVTAKDIEYSYKQAQSAASSFSSRFSYISSYNVKGEAFTVLMNSTAKRNLNLLDIPIIKKDSDKNSLFPIGSGRYYLTEANGTYALKANTNWIMGNTFGIQEIQLTDVPDMNTLYHTFSSGDVTAVFADINGSGASYTGDIDIKEFSVNTLTFIGTNFSKGYLTDKRIRKAISQAINRPKLVSETLLTHAESAWHPFNPKWKEVSGIDLPKDIYSRDEAAALLDEALFTKGKSGKRGAGGAETIITILVSNDNRYKTDTAAKIAEDLSKVDINAQVKAVNPDEYLNLINSGNFDLFLGEVKIPQNMDINILFSPAVNKGNWSSETFIKALSDYNNGLTGLDTAITAFSDECPFIPLYYKNCALAVSRNVTGEILPVQNDIFGGIQNWAMK